MQKEVRTLNENDIDFVYEELKLSMLEQHVLHRFNHSKTQFSEFLFDKASVAQGLVLFINEARSGFALYTTDHRNFTLNSLPNVYLNDLYVSKNSRRLGGATLLLNAIQKIAKEKGCGQIEWLVQKDNQAAQGFYKNFNLTRLCHDLEYVRLKLS